MKVITTTKALKAEMSVVQRQGSKVVLVTTMGNLHQGHLNLVIQGVNLSPNHKVVCTIFVNPLQFTSRNPENNDFDKYPRTFEEDAKKLESVGCHYLFAPESVEEIYSKYPPDTTVNVGPIGKILEGEFRPGFFEGVATVITILINLVRPSAIIMGEKDWQQLQVVKQFVNDLRMDVEVIPGPTGRETSELAMSSRNNYLSAEEKITASSIFKTLESIKNEIEGGNRNFEILEKSGTETLTGAGFIVEYLTIRKENLDFPTTEDLLQGQRLVVLVAAMLNSTRLIDNVVIEI